ncbi:hypothetical protein F4802DRAFT_416169 [Xylaria palmicola]|nr:hypothetical protein F4802DRAFT_416169 [Xylaria palmicola]
MQPITVVTLSPGTKLASLLLTWLPSELFHTCIPVLGIPTSLGAWVLSPFPFLISTFVSCAATVLATISALSSRGAIPGVLWREPPVAKYLPAPRRQVGLPALPNHRGYLTIVASGSTLFSENVLKTVGLNLVWGIDLPRPLSHATWRKARRCNNGSWVRQQLSYIESGFSLPRQPSVIEHNMGEAAVASILTGVVP